MDVEHVPFASVGGGNDVRLKIGIGIGHEADVAEEGFVEDPVDCVAVIHRPLRFARDAGALGRIAGVQTGRHEANFLGRRQEW